MSRFHKIKYYHKTFLNIALTKKEIIELADRFSKLVIDKVIEAPFVPGVIEFIENNFKKYKLFISTGTPNDEINHILDKRNIRDYFTAVYGSPENKSRHINHLRDQYKLRSTELLFIGDSMTDLDAAIKHNIQFLLRIHENNKAQFSKYAGKAIFDLNSLDLYIKKIHFFR